MKNLISSWVVPLFHVRYEFLSEESPLVVFLFEDKMHYYQIIPKLSSKIQLEIILQLFREKREQKVLLFFDSNLNPSLNIFSTFFFNFIRKLIDFKAPIQDRMLSYYLFVWYFVDYK